MKPVDLQDKQAWCAWGDSAESEFLEKVAPMHGFDLMQHPDKERNVYATDFQGKFLNQKTGMSMTLDIDLKRVTTPFFKSRLYGYEPNHTVTLNHKDYLRYRNKYPDWGNADMCIMFWVTWGEQERYGTSVKSKNGVWSLRLNLLDSWVKNGRARCHEYRERKGGNGSNAPSSWLVDLRLCRRHYPQKELTK